MTAPEFIITYRQTAANEALDQLARQFAFDPANNEKSYPTDKNIEFRTQLVGALLHDLSIENITLIRALFDEEVICDRQTGRHDNLYQLCFYLFQLGQLEDTFRLYDAKFNATNMDTDAMLDQMAMLVGHQPREVMAYVTERFESDADLKHRYHGIIEALQDLIDEPDDDVEHYAEFLKGYFYGHKKATLENEPEPRMIEPIKPWWKFW